MSGEIEPFHAIAIGQLAHRLKAEGRSIIHMDFGQPSSGAPSAALAAAHRVLDREALGYWESTPLKAKIAERYARDHHVEIDPRRILLTAGASPALVLALAASFKPSDTIAMARPNYVAYRNVARGLHMIPLEIDCGAGTRFQLTANHLAKLDPAAAGVIVASPANPTGTIIPAGELRAIAGICHARNIRMISDEIYHGISYGEPTRSMLEFAPDALVINSFSKYYSMAGWRLGWLICPDNLVTRARAYAANFFLTAPSLSQHAALAAFDCDDELQGHVEVYRTNRALMLEALPGLGLASIAPPDGAFYVYADIGHLTQNSLAFCEKLLRDTGVATAPGIDFDPVNGNRFMRFSFAVSTAEVKEALARLKPWFASLA
jgi:aspartate/methionine/tyrosine aminotransferase